MANPPNRSDPPAGAVERGEIDLAPRPWFLYLIECRDGSLYAGVTVDVAARYAAHASGKGARYTRSHPPQALVGVRQFADRSSALRAECHIKRLRPADKRRYIEGKQD